MIEQLNELDHAAFLFLNGLHVYFLDDFMVLITKTATWIPFYALLVFFLYKKFGKNIFWVLLIIALTITLADQFASSFMKPLVARLRPCNVYKVHLLVGCGEFGFISSHAANTFALAFLIANFFKKNWIFFGMFLWASIVSYSRIYVGVHYPADLFFGALSGVFFAFFILKIFQNRLRTFAN